MSAKSRTGARSRAEGRRASGRAGKVRKEFWLRPQKLARARELLGAATDVEAVEMALDLVTFRGQVTRGIDVLGGMGLSRID